MCKSLYLEPGHFARCGELWYEPGILMIIEQHERVEIFTARHGMPGIRRGSYSYEQLDPQQLPAGLRSAEHDTETPTVRSLAYA